MEWWILVAIASALLLGWGVGVWYGTNNGYDAALEEYRQLENQKLWSSFFEGVNKTSEE